jgi:hypothetical protein
VIASEKRANAGQVASFSAIQRSLPRTASAFCTGP